MKIGFIGLGNMGYPMARNLIHAGFDCCLYDINEAPVNKLVAEGASSVRDLCELASAVDFIAICVKDEQDVDHILSHGLLENAQSNSVIAIHSTVTIAAIKRWQRAGSAHNVTVIDAPVTGDKDAAYQQNLCYMVGADETTFVKVAPVFQSSAKVVIHAGVQGSGMALKLCNNLMRHIAFTGMNEAYNLAESTGLDTHLVTELGKVSGIITDVMQGFVNNRDTCKQQLSNSEFTGLFEPFAKLAEKDLSAALSAADTSGIHLPLTTITREHISNVFLKNN